MGQVVNNVAQFCVEPEGIMMEFLPSKLKDFIWENDIYIRSDELDAGVDDVIYVPYLDIDLNSCDKRNHSCLWIYSGTYRIYSSAVHQ